jgi:putative ABC transport system ATP-binding protein
MIEIKNISKSFSGRKIFDNFSFDINKCDLVLIKGVSGIGKSTLFNILMGFDFIEAGEIFFNNIPYSEIEIQKVRSKTTWLPQNTNVIGQGKTIDYLLDLKKLTGNKDLKYDKEQILNYFSQLNLEHDTIEKHFSNLSGGERQRIGLIICKILNRDIILLDEPTSALDSESTQKAIEFIIKMRKTTICISHNSDMDTYFNKQIILN